VISRRLFAAFVLGLLVGCSGPAPQAPTVKPDIVADAIRAFERSDWVPAARMLREALVKEPGNLTLHYYLAIAATHLDLVEEAVREFQWVLANAPAGSTESQTARKWLTDAGRLGRDATTVASKPADDAPANAASLHGQIVWTDGESPVPKNRLQLFLKGLADTPTKDEYYVLRTDEGGRFNFKRVVPGPYKLTNRIAGEPTWRLRVQVEANQDATLDLTPQNSFKNRDDFPQDGK
jgi:Carboxypeptidase regulatory-like domain